MWADQARRAVIDAMNHHPDEPSVVGLVAPAMHVESAQGMAALRAMEQAERDRAKLARRRVDLGGD